MDRVVYLAAGRAASGPTAEVITSEVLSRLYGYRVDVLHVAGRVLVVAGDAADERAAADERDAADERAAADDRAAADERAAAALPAAGAGRPGMHPLRPAGDEPHFFARP